jgi:methyl acetate hydrolase
MVYRRGDNGWIENPADQSHQPYILGDATLISTGEDFGRYLQMLLNNGEYEGTRILAEESVQKMTKNQIGELSFREVFNGFPFGAGIDKFGLGFQIRTDTPHEKLTRSPGSYSWAGSYNTFLWVDPEQEIATVLLMHYLPFFDDTAQHLLAGFEERIYRFLQE